MSAPTRARPVGISGLTCDNRNVSDPRNAPTSGGPAGNLSGGPDVGIIAPIHSPYTSTPPSAGGA